MELKVEKTTNRRFLSKLGFTVVELLVTVSIFTIVMSIILANYPQFNSRIVLENMAHQIALSIREAQVYGTSVRELIGTQEFPSYGVHFCKDNCATNDPSDARTFVLFADLLPGSDPTNNDKMYNGATDCSASGGECVEQFSMQGANTIVHLCGNVQEAGVADIDTAISDGYCDMDVLDVAFTRPNPEAYIIGDADNLPPSSSNPLADAEIVIESPKGDREVIIVWSTGQISVE